MKRRQPKPKMVSIRTTAVDAATLLATLLRQLQRLDQIAEQRSAGWDAEMRRQVAEHRAQLRRCFAATSKALREARSSSIRRSPAAAPAQQQQEVA